MSVCPFSTRFITKENKPMFHAAIVVILVWLFPKKHFEKLRAVLIYVEKVKVLN
jgi:hypothetical protein